MTVAEGSLTVLSGLSIVECVGCRSKFKNNKCYYNHQQSCTKYVVEASQCLHLKQKVTAKKAEALAKFQAIAIKEPELQPASTSPDLETSMDVVGFLLS